MLNDAERTLWTDTLQVVDVAAMERPNYGTSPPDYYKVTVTKISKGFIEATSRQNQVFRFRKADGREVNGDKYHPRSIQSITNEVRESWRKASALTRIKSVVWDNLSLEELEAVVTALKLKEG